MYSLGDLSKYSKYNDDEDEKYIQAYGSAAYGFVLRKHDKKTKVVREGYFALKCLKENGRLTGINLLAYGANAEKNDEDENILVAVQRLMHGVMPWQRMITLGDIFDVIGQTIPEKYQYLSDFSVNQICARTYELAPGNIFFFRRQFNDKNDKKLESEYLRNRLPFRAFSRRSLFVFSYKKLPSFIPHAVIDDPTEAHIKVMAWYKEKIYLQSHSHNRKHRENIYKGYGKKRRRRNLQDVCQCKKYQCAGQDRNQFAVDNR